MTALAVANLIVFLVEAMPSLVSAVEQLGALLVHLLAGGTPTPAHVALVDSVQALQQSVADRKAAVAAAHAS